MKVDIVHFPAGIGSLSKKCPATEMGKTRAFTVFGSSVTFTQNWDFGSRKQSGI